MSRISHFQRFSQRENHATNNTLLLLRYFYRSSPFKLQNVLTSLLDTELQIGLSFRQQVKGAVSVPDGLITQERIRIYIETKRGGDLDPDQIRRHLQSMSTQPEKFRGDHPVLIGLTKNQIAEAECKILANEASGNGVKFTAVTFSQLAAALRAQCADYENELKSMLDDYEDYLAEEGLSETRNQWLVVFPCGTSIAENVRFGLYYEPASRSCKRDYRFIGVYNMKSVAYVGAVEAIAVAALDDGRIVLTPEAGKLTENHRQRAINAIDQTEYYDLKAEPHRFYLVDSFVATDAKKTSPQGIWGMRYLDLSKLIPTYNPRKTYSTQELATLLKGATWE